MGKYTDLQNKILSNIAYKDFQEKLESYRNNANDDSAKMPLSEALEDSDKQYFIKIGISEQELQSWKISAVHDTNSANGFYACVIETSPDDAVIAFRGSESFLSRQAWHDWIKADAGLLSSIQTDQQKEALNMLKENKNLLESYKNINLVGHSLGGNLAEYTAILSVGTFMESKIKSCVSLDGPGFSDEFISRYKDSISKMCDKISHYRWSLVGNCLIELPGVKYQYVKVSNESNLEDNEKYGDLTRHDLKYLYTDSNGSFVDSEQNDIAKICQFITKSVELANPNLVYVAVELAMWGKSKLFSQVTSGNKSAEKIALEATIAGIFIARLKIYNIAKDALVKLTSVIALVIASVCYWIGDFAKNIWYKIKDKAKEIGENIRKIIARKLNWVATKLEKMREMASSFIDQIWEFAGNLLFGANRYRQQSISCGPIIELDTFKMRNYADRLLAANRKISSIDSRINSLYGRVGLVGLWNLMQIDVLFSANYSISRCAQYLYETADEFESMERNLADRWS